MSKITDIFGGDFKKYKKISPPKSPPNIISGILFNNPFSFSKNMKIISEKSENQLFSIPLICLHSLSNDFQKSNFIFSEDKVKKSENQLAVIIYLIIPINIFFFFIKFTYYISFKSRSINNKNHRSMRHIVIDEEIF